MRENFVAFLPGELSRDRITGGDAAMGFFIGRISRLPLGVHKRLRKGLRNAGLGPRRGLNLAAFGWVHRQPHAPFIDRAIEQLGLWIVGSGVPAVAAVNGRAHADFLPSL